MCYAIDPLKCVGRLHTDTAGGNDIALGAVIHIGGLICRIQLRSVLIQNVRGDLVAVEGQLHGHRSTLGNSSAGCDCLILDNAAGVIVVLVQIKVVALHHQVIVGIALKGTAIIDRCYTAEQMGLAHGVSIRFRLLVYSIVHLNTVIIPCVRYGGSSSAFVRTEQIQVILALLICLHNREGQLAVIDCVGTAVGKGGLPLEEGRSHNGFLTPLVGNTVDIAAVAEVIIESGGVILMGDLEGIHSSAPTGGLLVNTGRTLQQRIAAQALIVGILQRKGAIDIALDRCVLHNQLHIHPLIVGGRSGAGRAELQTDAQRIVGNILLGACGTHDLIQLGGTALDHQNIVRVQAVFVLRNSCDQTGHIVVAGCVGSVEPCFHSVIRPLLGDICGLAAVHGILLQRGDHCAFLITREIQISVRC